MDGTTTVQHVWSSMVELDHDVALRLTEDLVDQLNAVIIRQQQQLDALAREVRELRQQGAGDSGVPAFRSLRDELPPHY